MDTDQKREAEFRKEIRRITDYLDFVLTAYEVRDRLACWEALASAVQNLDINSEETDNE